MAFATAKKVRAGGSGHRLGFGPDGVAVGRAGYFGTDCALSYNDQGKIEVLAGLNYRLNKRGPNIYIYEVPPEYHVK